MSPWTVPIGCTDCGGDLVRVSGSAAHRFKVSAMAECTGCHRQHMVHVLISPEYQTPQANGRKSVIGLPERVPKHGTVGEYTNHRCDCDPCRKAATDGARVRAAAKRALRGQVTA